MAARFIPSLVSYEGEPHAPHRRYRRPTRLHGTCSCKLAKFGVLNVTGTHLAWLGSAITTWILTALALFELVNDQNPKTPSRKVPPQFIARIVMGGFSGAAIGLALGNLWIGLVCGVIGAVIGTLGGAAVRGKLAAAFGKDLPAGLLEDAIAIVGAYLIVSHI
jgi:uncharacterized membrane protein